MVEERVRLKETVRLVSRVMDPCRGRWGLIGGLALGILGVPRTTFDLDLLVDERCLGTLDAGLVSAEYRLEHRWKESSHYLAGGGGHVPVDVLHARRIHTRNMLTRCHVVEIAAGLRVPVVEAEDLIGLKVQAMVNDPSRERLELVDIRALLESIARRGERLKGERIREYFALFGREADLRSLTEGLDALA